jgi:hypothetical protein
MPDRMFQVATLKITGGVPTAATLVGAAGELPHANTTLEDARTATIRGHVRDVIIEVI